VTIKGPILSSSLCKLPNFVVKVQSFIAQQIVSYNIKWWLTKRSMHLGTTRPKLQTENQHHTQTNNKSINDISLLQTIANINLQHKMQTLESHAHQKKHELKKTYLVFINVFSFLGFNLESMHVFLPCLLSESTNKWIIWTIIVVIFLDYRLIINVIQCLHYQFLNYPCCNRL
jgi:hypothetical protein